MDARAVDILLRVAQGLAGVALGLLTLRHFGAPSLPGEAQAIRVFGPGAARYLHHGTTLWTVRSGAAMLIVLGGVAAIGAAIARGRLAVGVVVVAVALGLAGVLALPGPTPQANYVLRGYGAVQFSGVFGRVGYPRTPVWVLLGLIVALGAARAFTAAARRD